MHNVNPLVIKIGGKFFDIMHEQEALVAGFFNHLTNLYANKRKVVLVHGGGSQVTDLLAKLGRTSKKLDGLRITPDEDINLVAGVLSGHLNKRLVAKCQSININAVGISLADGNLAFCSLVDEKLGWVGEPEKGSDKLIQTLFSIGCLPIVASIGSDSHGNLFNVNADHAALHIAELLDAELLLLSDVAGVLDADKVLLDTLNKEAIDQLAKQEVITDGMLVKVQAAESVASKLQRPVTIASWFTTDKGTKILPSQDHYSG